MVGSLVVVVLVVVTGAAGVVEGRLVVVLASSAGMQARSVDDCRPNACMRERSGETPS